MKIIKAAMMNPWWVGMDCKCSQCGQIVQLEEGDHTLPSVGDVRRDSIDICCENCSHWESYFRSVKENQESSHVR